MKRVAFTVLCSISLMTLAACGAEQDDSAPSEEMISTPAQTAADTAANEAAEGSPAASGSPRGSEVAVASEPQLSLPKLAYALDYGFRMAGEAIAPLQQTHADMCEAQGPYVCQIVSLSRSGEEEDEVRGTLQLAVASDKAREFATRLTETAKGAGAESVRADITGEDLSKSIVDTEARLRTRIALRDRLLEVLKTRTGKVEELVEAERGVAAVNEEIDQARSWLNEQKGRVAYSKLTLSYESATPGGSFLRPVEGALSSVGSILGIIVAALILAGTVALPILLLVFGIRRFQQRTAASAPEA